MKKHRMKNEITLDEKFDFQKNKRARNSTVTEVKKYQKWKK